MMAHRFFDVTTTTVEELGDAIPDKPVIFNKFGSIAHRIQPDKVLDLSDILPTDKGPVHYEAEICLQLGVLTSGRPNMSYFI